MGDEVFGDTRGLRTGSIAEYFACDSRILALKPSNVTHVQAASVPLAALTAIQCFRKAGWEPEFPPSSSDKQQQQQQQEKDKDKEERKQRRRVLVLGGAGGVGTLAIQLAKQLYKVDRLVTTASPGPKTDLCRRLGADEVVNYRARPFEETLQGEGEVFDCILDLTNEYNRCGGLLAPGGTLVSVLGPPTSSMLREWVDKMGSVGAHVSCLVRSVIDYGGFLVDAVALGAMWASSAGSYKYVITCADAADMSVLARAMEKGLIQVYI